MRALQVRLQRHGLRPGPVDGLFGPRTQAAVERLQRSRGIPVSGVATAKTRQADRSRARAAADQSVRPTRRPPSPTPQTPATDRRRSGDQPWLDRASVERERVGRRDRAGRRPDRVAALLLGLIAGALLGRRNRVVSGTAVPLAQGVVAEGTTNTRCGRPLPRNRARARARTTRIASCPGGSLPGERSGHPGPVLGLPGRGVEHRAAGSSPTVPPAGRPSARTRLREPPRERGDAERRVRRPARSHRHATATSAAGSWSRWCATSTPEDGTSSGRGCSTRSTRSGAARPRASSSPSSGG